MSIAPEQFWQDILPAAQEEDTEFDTAFPAHLEDGRRILLPIRPLADGKHALASLIINQASFPVQDMLAAALAEKLRPLAPDVVVGLPTLGLTLAAAVARVLGHPRYVPLGTSRKFWYVDELSVPLSSITTPGQGKRLYIDPRMLPVLRGRRVALIDDVISSGTSLVAGLSLMATCGIEIVAIGAAMLQSERWRDKLALEASGAFETVQGVLTTPMLIKSGTGRWRAPG